MTKWLSTVPVYDDRNDLIIDEFIDGRTIHGPWAIMTPKTYKQWGVGLGVGKGQRYKQKEIKPCVMAWVKVEG